FPGSQMEELMGGWFSKRRTPPDQPLLDATPYGYGKCDSISDTSEKAAITHKEITLNGTTMAYVARAGHLVRPTYIMRRPLQKYFTYHSPPLAPTHQVAPLPSS